jgi:DMSO/TMAO reductase YedYZ molybdopterin-dependent catalytic subunit
MPKSLKKLVAALLIGLAAGAAAHDAPVETRPVVSESLTLSGSVQTPMVLTLADLEGFPPQQIGEVDVVCQSGANRGKKENLRGVLLKDILDRAGLAAESPRDFRHMAMIAKATDDYKVVFSWAEIFNSPTGDGIIVYFRKNGLPLGDDEGRIALISTRDTRTGPRNVKWLSEIEVRIVAE